MNAILQQARQMQAQLQAAQQEIVTFTIIDETGDGLVRVTMQGSGEIMDIAIDPKIVDPEDVNGLQDLVLAVSQGVTTKMQSLIEQEIGPLSRGFNGLDGLGFQISFSDQYLQVVIVVRGITPRSHR